MFDPIESETLWLNVTNIVLGLVTLVCFAAVVGVTIREVAARARKRVPVFANNDSHTLVLSDLGITMADGGEKIDESQMNSTKNDDSSNIHRSNN